MIINLKKEELATKKGAALLVAILVGILLSAFSIVLLTMLNNEMVIRKSSESKIKSKYISEAGLEEGIALINNSLYKNINGSLEEDKVVSLSIDEDFIVNGEKVGHYSVSFTPNVIEFIGSKTSNNEYILKSINPVPIQFTLVSIGTNLENKSVKYKATITFDIDIENYIINGYKISSWEETN